MSEFYGDLEFCTRLLKSGKICNQPSWGNRCDRCSAIEQIYWKFYHYRSSLRFQSIGIECKTCSNEAIYGGYCTNCLAQ
jgi:hypothetical protein